MRLNKGGRAALHNRRCRLPLRLNRNVIRKGMFITLLGVTFVAAVLVSFIVARMFAQPIKGILDRIITDDISAAWLKYLKFAIYVVGISKGVRVWKLNQPEPPA